MNLSNRVFGPTKFALIWIEIMMFHALLERVTSTNSETFLTQIGANLIGPKTIILWNSRNNLRRHAE